MKEICTVSSKSSTRKLDERTKMLKLIKEIFRRIFATEQAKLTPGKLKVIFTLKFMLRPLCITLTCNTLEIY